MWRFIFIFWPNTKLIDWLESPKLTFDYVSKEDSALTILRNQSLKMQFHVYLALQVDNFKM